MIYSVKFGVILINGHLKVWQYPIKINANLNSIYQITEFQEFPNVPTVESFIMELHVNNAKMDVRNVSVQLYVYLAVICV